MISVDYEKIVADKTTLQNYVNQIGPWHYCHLLPHGVKTGDSPPNHLPDKMDRLVKHGAFKRPYYGKVLDLGANSGIISMWFADNRKSFVDAYEIGPKYYPQLELAVMTKGYETRIIPHNEDIRTTSFRKNYYDLILFLGTMHHIGKEFYELLFRRCLKSLLPGGEIVVQTKTELNVLGMLEEVGFDNVRKLYDSEFYKRSAWMANKDPMKVPVNYG